ncbi:hypothetical protein NPX13_g10549 [Xylaria arbuscula]|uniref:Uncharacterized protein n=1 Tax=Xylaria arbuscula TaxID=114810 RepID=A0A9W8THD9_9PEZI|nr:hypothetical protein NPX13_g10549 [Xylaria arbuscula]
MGLFPPFPAIIGLVAVLATATILALEVVITCGIWSATSPARIVAVIAFIAETIVLGLLFLKLVKYFRGLNYRPRDLWGVWFALDLVASVLASVVSVTLLILVAKAQDLPKTITNVPLANVVTGSSIALGFSFISQLLFIVVYFVMNRLPESEQALSLHTNEEGRISPQLPMRVKTVPYERTKPAISQTRLNERGSSDYTSRPGTSSGRSAAETITSFSGSLSGVVRPIGSRTRLLSNGSRTGRRPDSLDSNTFRDRISVVEDGWSWKRLRLSVLDSWRRFPPALLAAAVPALAFRWTSNLRNVAGESEAIAPVPRPPPDRSATPSESQLHIHPLFRSDSPGPPPAVTPGTVVVAAPNAGQFITGRSVTRMRSGSLPVSPVSPLSRNASNESFRKTAGINGDRLQPENVGGEERKMTPPIPDWVLNAGSKSSLSEYQVKRQNS